MDTKTPTDQPIEYPDAIDRATDVLLRERLFASFDEARRIYVLAGEDLAEYYYERARRVQPVHVDGVVAGYR